MQYPEQAAHVRGSVTSHAAAQAVEKRGKLTREREIYDAIKQYPQTTYELSQRLGYDREVIVPRCSEMKARGLLNVTGETREGKYGIQTEVLQVIAPYSRKISCWRVKKVTLSLADIELLKTAHEHAKLAAVEYNGFVVESALRKILESIK